MTDKGKEAIEYFKKRIDICMENANICDDNDFDEEATCLRKEQILTETVLNLAQTQQAEIEQLKIAGNGMDLLLKQKTAEIEKKDKIIDLTMAFITKHYKEDEDIEKFAKEVMERGEWTNLSKILREYFERIVGNH